MSPALVPRRRHAAGSLGNRWPHPSTSAILTRVSETRDEAAADAPTSESDEFASRVIDQIYDLFIFPELQRRGIPPERSAVAKALVTLAPNMPTVVQLNDEAVLAFSAASTRAIDAGEEITLADIDPTTITGLRPHAIDPDAGWVAIAEFPGIGVVVAFDFTRNRGRARRMLDKAASFCAAAEESVASERICPALDLAFSATELAVSAMMSLLVDEEPRVRSRHGRRTAWFAQWTRLGNSPREFHLLLSRLAELRPAARYGDGDPLPLEEVRSLLTEVRDLLDHARDRVGDALPELPHGPVLRASR